MEELKEGIEKGKEACNTIRKAVEEKMKACNRLEQELSAKEEERHQQEKGISELELMLQAKMQLEYQTLSTKTDFLTEQMHGYSDALEKLLPSNLIWKRRKNSQRNPYCIRRRKSKSCKKSFLWEKKHFPIERKACKEFRTRSKRLPKNKRHILRKKRSFAEAQLNQEKEALRLENQKEN